MVYMALVFVWSMWPWCLCDLCGPGVCVFYVALVFVIYVALVSVALVFVWSMWPWCLCDLCGPGVCVIYVPLVFV